MAESDIKQQIIKMSKLMYDKDLTDTIGGNISVRADDRIYITRTGSSVYKNWDIDEDWVIETDLNGKTLKKEEQSLLSKGSIIHFELLNQIPTIKSVIHGHSNYALSFSNLRLPIPIVTRPGRNQGFPPYIECIPGTPNDSKEEAVLMTKYFKYLYDKNPKTAFACTSAGHGLYVGGTDLIDAFKKFHIIEVNARSFYQMQIIKQSDYFREMRAREKDNMYVYWPDIEKTKIEALSFQFEKFID